MNKDIDALINSYRWACEQVAFARAGAYTSKEGLQYRIAKRKEAEKALRDALNK